jgi:hypothetical protein
MLLQVIGLALLPAAVWYGISHDDIYSELVLAAMGVALLMIGRNLRGARVR